MPSFKSIAAAEYQNLSYETMSKAVSYYVKGEEICPTTGRVHWQYFIQFSSSVDANTIKRWNKEFHFEAAKCDKQARDYCKKGEQSHAEWVKHKQEGPNYGLNAKVVEWGTYVAKYQGQRNDINYYKDEIMAGRMTPNTVMIADFALYNRYRRSFFDLHDYYMKGIYRTWETECDWYYGDTGSGKSHHAFDNYDPLTTYVFPNQDHGWWDMYCGEETVIINEFRGTLPYGYLLTLMDKWPESVSRRGRAPMSFLAKKVIVTSATHPEIIYQNLCAKEGDIAQLLDRIQLIHVIGSTKRKRKIELVIDNNRELSLPPCCTSAVNSGTSDIVNTASPVFQRKLNII